MSLAGIPLPPPMPVLPQEPETLQSTPEAEKPKPTHCASCRKEGAQLRCSVCRKVVYCTSQCQKSDWTFHKRICEKPKKAEPKPSNSTAAPAADGGSSSSSTSAEPASDSKPAAAAAPPKSTAEVLGDDDLDDDEKAAVEEVRKKGYRYFSRKLDDKETAAIGDIRPKSVTSPPAATPGPAAASAAASSTAPKPVPVAAAPSTSSASEWNKSGTTYEARNLGDFVRTRIKELLHEARKRGDLSASLPGIGKLVVTGIAGWGDSSADVIISRGKTKKIYDLAFKVVAQLVPEENAAGSNSDEMEDTAAESKEGEDSASDSSKKSSEEKSEATKKNPRVLLYFKEVSNETEDVDTGREVEVQWGSPAPAAAQRDTIKTALAVGRLDAGITSVVRRVVEQVVAEFKSK